MTLSPPSPLTAHLGLWLRLVSNHVSLSFARRLASLDVTVAEWVLMRMLFDADDMAPSDIAAAMGMTRGAISKLADRLVERRLVAREPDRVDRRSHRLSLTAEGRALVPQLATLADENDAEFFGSLDAATRRTLEEVLRDIVAAHHLVHPPVG